MKRIVLGQLLGIIALGLPACSKKDASGTVPSSTVASTASSVASTPPSAAPVEPQTAPSVTASAAAPTEEASETPPESFSGGTAVANQNAKGLGCEAKAKQGWLQLLCRKKNGTGGHPKRAVLGAEGDAPEIVPDEHGELKLIVPWHSGASQSGFVEWTDTKYTLEAKDAELKLEWASSLELRRTCAGLEKTTRAVIVAAQKQEAPDHLTAAESGKLPRFGNCQPAGLGSWALALRGLAASGSDAARSVKFEIDVVYVDLEGVVTKGDFGAVEVKPGGFEVRPLQVYDYDDDGSDELIVPYDVKAIASDAAPANLPMIWTKAGGQVSAYAKAPPITGGGAQTTHLEFDMRPDIGQYGPFVAYFPSDCGIDKCPTRLTGPVLYARSMPDGTFSYSDKDAKSSVDRACGKRTPLVVEAGGANLVRTAQNVACARLRGEASDSIVTELKGKSSVLCKSGDTCPILEKLIGFANASFER
jgi:hypothetical protein